MRRDSFPQPRPDGTYPLHRLDEAIDRLLAHCDQLAELGYLNDVVSEIRQIGESFARHFLQLSRLRRRIALVAETLERP